MASRPIRLLFVVNVDWFFLSHRLPLAIAAREAGYEVIIAAGDTGQGQRIEAAGFPFVALPLSRKGTSLIGELNTLLFVIRTYRRLRPDIVHQVTIKPTLYGSLAARIAGKMGVVSAISGLGYTFMSGNRSRWLRPLVHLLYRAAMRYRPSRVIFQNPDDRDLFLNLGFVEATQTRMIRGSGVDCAVFTPGPEPAGDPVVMLPARMLWDKGIGEFVEAARLVKMKRPNVRFVLVGQCDKENPAAIQLEQVQSWSEAGLVEYWGFQNRMEDVLPKAHLVVLPSYREGLPKVLLEAAACGRAIIAADVPGCREIVRPGVNGLLVPARDAAGLAQAIEQLLTDVQLRLQFASAGREMVVQEFAESIVVAQTLDIYKELLGELSREQADGGEA